LTDWVLTLLIGISIPSARRFLLRLALLRGRWFCVYNSGYQYSAPKGAKNPEHEISSFFQGWNPYQNTKAAEPHNICRKEFDTQQARCSAPEYHYQMFL
jgi:hypothetical protein